MDNVLHLKKIGCTSCGAELVFDPGTQMANCNFCGNAFEIEKAVDEEVVTPDGILPFQIQKETYENKVKEWLSEGDYTPDDILNSSIFESVNGVYLPMWYFKGTYTGNWSASSGYDRQEEYIGKGLDGKLQKKTRTVTDWRPASGSVNGEFACLAFAGTGQGIPSETAAYAHGVTFERGAIKPYDTKYTLGFSILEFSNSDIDCWESIGKSQADHTVEMNTVRRIPGDKYKDFFVDALYDKEDPKRFYIPFWITYYNYNGKMFSVYMDGTTTTRIQGERPVDEERVSLVKKLKLKIYAIGISSTILLTYIVDLIANAGVVYDDDRTAWPAVIAAIVCVVATALVLNNQVNKILNESKERRQRILSEHLGNNVEDSSSTNQSEPIISESIESNLSAEASTDKKTRKNNLKRNLIAGLITFVIATPIFAYLFGAFDSNQNSSDLSESEKLEQLENALSELQEDTGEDISDGQIDNSTEISNVIATASSSILASGGLTYDASNAVDGNLKTWWSPKGSSGQWLELKLDKEHMISGIRIHAGSHYPSYTTSSGKDYGDLYTKNYRIRTAKIVFSDGTSEMINLDDVDEIQEVIFDESRSVRWLKIYPQELYESDLWKDICISEIEMVK